MKAFLFISLACSWTALNGQDIHVTSNIFISDDIALHAGSFTNAGFVSNGGSIYIQGDWTNRLVYQGPGKVVLNGESQMIDHNGQAISRLELRGIGRKTLKNTLKINNRLVLSEGHLIVHDDARLVMAEAATVEGGSHLSYVEGTFTVSGNGFKLFPLGIDGIYLPVEYLDLRGIDQVLSLSLKRDAPSIPSRVGVQPYQRYYWQQRNLQGSFESTPLSLTFPHGEESVESVAIIEGSMFDEPFDVLPGVLENAPPKNNLFTTTSVLKKDIFLFAKLNTPAPASDKAFYLSTTLSPNATLDENKKVKVFGDNLSESDFIFVVYNRWGNIVFETSSLSAMKEGWNGHNAAGQMLLSGAYPYILKVRTLDGTVKEQKGFINILY